MSNPSLLVGYVTVCIDDREEHLCEGCAFDTADGVSPRCFEVNCDGVIFTPMVGTTLNIRELI